MPTGYAEAIKDDITLEQYAMRCARAWGALIMMRDDPLDAPIPEEIPPTTWYKEHLKEEQDRLALLESLSIEDASSMNLMEFNKAMEVYEKRMQGKTILRQKYIAMRNKVSAWEVSEPYLSFKSFMIEQIDTSMEGDCNVKYEQTPVLIDTQQWLQEQIAQTQKQIAYFTEQDAEEVARCADRNAWLRGLREALRGVE